MRDLSRAAARTTFCTPTRAFAPLLSPSIPCHSVPGAPGAYPQVYTDFMTSDEYFSDAKALEPVVWKNEKGEDVDTGLVRCLAVKQTAGGIKLAGVGGSGAGAGFGGEKGDAEDDGGDDGEEAEETKCVCSICGAPPTPVRLLTAHANHSLPAHPAPTPRLSPPLPTGWTSSGTSPTLRTSTPLPALPPSRRTTSCPSW